MIILAIGLGVGLKKDGSSKSDVPSVPAARRINCAPETTGDGMSDSISAEACAQRGCVYAPSDNPNVPVCFINPSEGSGYRLEVTEDINTVNVKSYILQAVGKGMYEPPIPRIKLTVEEWGNSVLRIKVCCRPWGWRFEDVFVGNTDFDFGYFLQSSRIIIQPSDNSLRPRQNGHHFQAFSNAFSWMKMYEFRLKFHWSLSWRVNMPALVQIMAWRLPGASHYLN